MHSTPSPSPSIWQPLPGGSGTSDENRCIDVSCGDVTNGNVVWAYPCNRSPAQQWHRDRDNNYIKSTLDQNKCLVGESLSTDLGTRLVIYDCIPNDDRFRWDIYEDKSIRPRNNNKVCIQIDSKSTSGPAYYLILDDCENGKKEWEWGYF